MTGTSPDPQLRRSWLAVLAHAPREALQRHGQALSPDRFEWLREPEVGLAMVRARIGNRGDRFNLGETTLTRCVVRHRGAQGQVSAGVGYVLGRDAQRAGWVARIDALLQQPEHHEAVMREVIEPLRAAIERERGEQHARTAASRVRFFTLQPEVGQ
ncbi:MAG TPA: phosphonate C-P lyase system protein PhnG [Albitalea sp.]|uniref:phosphonate C-P lyase system protein PhnG n=1 Tax=Piscinibacter sp. TaxID=1903157 RepID=UPI002ED08155